jgi:hypothetical protein
MLALFPLCDAVRVETRRPPHTATSPCRTVILRTASLRFSPPNWNAAGKPSDTDTIGRA